MTLNRPKQLTQNEVYVEAISECQPPVSPYEYELEMVFLKAVITDKNGHTWSHQFKPMRGQDLKTDKISLLAMLEADGISFQPLPEITNIEVNLGFSSPPKLPTPSGEFTFAPLVSHSFVKFTVVTDREHVTLSSSPYLNDPNEWLVNPKLVTGTYSVEEYIAFWKFKKG